MLKSKLKKISEQIKSDYVSFKENYRDYISYFGDIYEIFCSPYFHIALIISVVITFFANEQGKWAGFALGGLPSILGFSIGGYAIIITFGDSEFREFLTLNRVDDKPLLLIVNGTFIHFIFAQTIAYLCALIVATLQIEIAIFNFLLIIPFVYSITLSVALAFSIKTISSWYVKFIKNKKKKEKERSKE